MAEHILKRELTLDLPLEQVFAFFADAANLEAITPRFLRFRVITPTPIAMGAGALIDYRLRLHGIPLTWKTEITEWDPPHRFVDTQLRGPYAEWVHTHTFEDDNGGTRIRDHVRYRLPGFWPITAIANALLVARDTRQIFDYRRATLERLFR